MNIVFDLDGTLANLDHRLHYIRLMVGSTLAYQNDDRWVMRVMSIDTDHGVLVERNDKFSPPLRVTLADDQDFSNTITLDMVDALKLFKPDWDAFHAGVIDDDPIEEMVSLFKMLRDSGIVREGGVVGKWIEPTLIICTGRSDVAEHDTMFWLEEHQIQPDDIYFRRAGDHRPDVKVKFDMYTTLLSKDMKPDLVFEDRQGVVDMWRSHGVRVAQVAPGNF